MPQTKVEILREWAAFINHKTNVERSWGISFDGLRTHLAQCVDNFDPKEHIKFQLVYSQFVWSDQEWMQSSWKWTVEGVDGRGLSDRDFRTKYLIAVIEKIFNKGKQLGVVNITKEEMLMAFWLAVSLISKDNFPYADIHKIREELMSLYQPE